MFCPKCGSILKPKEGNIACSCGYLHDKDITLELNINDKSRNIDIIEKEEQGSKLIIDEKCPKCGHDKAYYWTHQSGPSDEPEDQVFRCVKCGYGWRDRYDA
jgi:DNA-directed RNA polymerase subunit M